MFSSFHHIKIFDCFDSSNILIIESFISFCGNILSNCFDSFLLWKALENSNSLFVFLVDCQFLSLFLKCCPKWTLCKFNLCYHLTSINKDNIFSPVKFSYLSIFHDENDDIFVASLLILHCSILILIISSIFMVTFCILSKILHLKRKRLSDARWYHWPRKSMVLQDIFCEASWRF